MANHFDTEDYETDAEMVADGLFAIANAIRHLGNADAATPMGGLEALGAVILEAAKDHGYSMSAIAEAIDRHGS